MGNAIQNRATISMGFITIASGKFRGRKIRTPEGLCTRPLLTRLRKSLVDILRPQLGGARVLDLFGGSGAIAFELLSNGALSATVVELSPRAADLINLNIHDLNLEESGEVFNADGIASIAVFAGQKAEFDIIVIAPPYGQGLQQQALDALEHQKILAAGGTVIIQRSEDEPVSIAAGSLQFLRTRKYGRTVFDFFGYL